MNISRFLNTSCHKRANPLLICLRVFFITLCVPCPGAEIKLGFPFRRRGHVLGLLTGDEGVFRSVDEEDGNIILMKGIDRAYILEGVPVEKPAGYNGLEI